MVLRERSLQLKHCKQDLVDRILKKYKISEKDIQSDTWKGIVETVQEGATDSGLKAMGGVFLAHSLSQLSMQLASTTAPLAIAAILVDVGKEYLAYRSKKWEQGKAAGAPSLSETSQRLLMSDFTRSVGHHIVSGGSAAAGAGVGAYALSAWTTALWTGGAASLTGPVGWVAATTAALLGGAVGYLAGSHVYSSSAAAYFSDLDHAREDILRLELGAQVLFNEYDPNNTGSISKQDCRLLIQRLAEGAHLGGEEKERALAFLENNENFNEGVTWAIFREWVSVQALQRLDQLPKKDIGRDLAQEAYKWTSTMSEYFNPKKAFVPPTFHQCMYPSVLESLGYVFCTGAKQDSARFYTRVTRAQLEQLIRCGKISLDDAESLIEDMLADDPKRIQRAWKVLETLIRIQEDEESEEIAEGFTGEDIDVSFEAPTNEECQGNVLSSSCNVHPIIRENVNVLCSLLSKEGLVRLIQSKGIAASTLQSHNELHYRVLLLYQNQAPNDDTLTGF